MEKALNKRLSLIVRQVLYTLRGGFLVRPLSIALVLGCVGALLSECEETYPILSAWVPRAIFPSHTDPQVAQVILGGIAASIMTVVSIVFAILLMTLTLASMQFSPRIIVSFSRDRVTQWTLGIFLGTFSYCMAALPAARSMPHPFAPVATVLGAMVLAITCVTLLLFFIHHISHAISVNYIVDRIAVETEAVIDDMMPRPRMFPHLMDVGPTIPVSGEAAVQSVVSGYIRFIDTKRLVELAKSYRVAVLVLRRVGHFVPAGLPLLNVSKPERLSPENHAELARVFDIGPSRTLQQDIEYGVLQIVDIALKAISPAVNDPTTAINCIDQLLCSAFDQIRHYAKGDIAVSLRLLRALGDLAISTEDPTFHRALVEQGRRITAGCEQHLGEQEMKAIRARLATLEESVSAGQRLPTAT